MNIKRVSRTAGWVAASFLALAACLALVVLAVRVYLNPLNPTGADTTELYRPLDPNADLFVAGTEAPGIELPDLHTGETVSLAQLRGRPVVMVFGSFSCDVLQDHLEEIDRVKREFSSRAHFLFVAVDEAGHEIRGYEFLLAPLDKESEFGDRAERVRRAAERRGFHMRILLDTEREARCAYKAWPLRLVALDAEGRIGIDFGIGTNREWDFTRLRRWLEAQSVGHDSPENQSHDMD